jgi:hypothetical protein
LSILDFGFGIVFLGPAPLIMRESLDQQTTEEEKPSAFSLQPSAFSLQPSAFSLQPSAFSLQPSAFSLQPSAFRLSLQH